jgi:hypothetical protein
LTLFDRAGLRGALVQLVAFNSRALTVGLQDRLEPGVEFVVGGHLVKKGVVDLAGIVQARNCMIGLRQRSSQLAVTRGRKWEWQVNRKADEGSGHPDRDAQFKYINAEVLVAQAAGQPVISVDTKKKELVGNYRNAGSDWRLKGFTLAFPSRACGSRP